MTAVGALSMGVTCGGGPRPDPPPTGSGEPTLTVTLNGVEDAQNDVMIVPPSGFVVNVQWQSGAAPVDPRSLSVELQSASGARLVLGSVMQVIDGQRAVGIVPSQLALPMGSHRLFARIYDQNGVRVEASLPFAVRSGVPPIGSDQVLWLDFDADRDATPGADFDVDLSAFGFSSPGAPQLHAAMRDRVIEAILDRVAEAYFDSNPNALPGGDPIEVSFVVADPGLPSTTRVCVGGAASVAGLVGSILLDPGNLNRESDECATIPPTGIFPRGLLAYAAAPGFRQYLDPLRPAAGGTPVGAHPLDAVVLDPAFDPATADAEALARLVEIEDAVAVFGDVLGSIVAHEIGHALGLVPPAAPGVGLFGGDSGAAYTHDVNPDGTTPAENYLMKAGNSFSFEALGGLYGQPLPAFRALDHAYLRDRVVIDPRVTAILPPPRISSVSPNVISTSLQTFTITGADFVATPAVRLIQGGFVHNAYSEVFVSSTEIRATCSRSSLYPGSYTVEVMNPDGQWDELPDAIVAP